ncbi:MAG: threonylcarbamoyl-AMP synthase, partial [Alistipes sp.]|nr:threonylcarbamoyl-AMP synthase [Alistipes sp.]
MLTKIYAQNPSERELRRVVAALADDGVVIYPTDSRYAFGCAVRSVKGIERLRRLKGKETQFALVFADLAQVAGFCRVDNAAFRILKRNLPGPFTFVLPASSRVPDKTLGKRRTIGVRIPAHPVARAIVEASGTPLVTASVRQDDETQEYMT